MSAQDALIAGRYRLVAPLGRGGMGIVWEAWDERLHRRVAVKQLHPYVGLSSAEAQVADDRAMREARITARLHHPHAVPVFDVVEHEGRPCLIMPYLPSTSLQTRLHDSGVLTPAEVARIGAELASALAAAHRAGIVHRDVKPGNVLIAQDGSAKISDFGISHAVGDIALTSTGMISGTPAYLAPEVARGADSGVESDVFSLGATLYAALEGAPPFGTDSNPMALLHRVAAGQAPPPQHEGPLAQLLERMLADEPRDRPSMDAVAQAMPALVRDPTPTRHDLSWDRTAEDHAAPTTYADAPTTSGTTASLPEVEAPRRASTGVDPPPVHPAPRRSRARVAVVGAALALALGLLASYLVVGRSGGADRSAAPSSTSSSAVAPTTTAPSSAPRSTSPPASSPASVPAPSVTATGPATASVTTTAAPPSATAGAPTAAQLAATITSYYRLLPGDTDAGWSRLSGRYQTTIAKNRATYESFWGSVRRVAVSDTTGAPPDHVTASITYDFEDGRVVTELTSFTVVASGGALKIDDSSVLSSR